MSESRFLVRKVAVLGAGVMGAQIAAHLANASVPVLLFDLAAKEGDANGIARKAIENLRKLEPSPLATKDRADYIDAANYDQHLTLLAGCDLVIEAISERMDWKKALYEKVAPHLGGHAIFASNTSGLSINALAEACPTSLRSRFCGIHFFNPPRYMHLVELIAQKDTESTLLDQLETFLVTTLGKGVVRARDTPNFVANRVGVFSMLATMVHTERFGLGLRRGRRIDRPGDRAREECDLSHRRRRGPRHACPCHPDHGRDAPRRSVARLLSVAGVAEGAHCQGCAGTKDEGGRVPESRQGYPGP